MTITNPAVQAQLATDYAEGNVPVWNPNDETQAQAYVDYFNNLATTVGGQAEGPMTLVTKTTYEVSISTEEPE